MPAQRGEVGVLPHHPRPALGQPSTVADRGGVVELADGAAGHLVARFPGQARVPGAVAQVALAPRADFEHRDGVHARRVVALFPRLARPRRFDGVVERLRVRGPAPVRADVGQLDAAAGVGRAGFGDGAGHRLDVRHRPPQHRPDQREVERAVGELLPAAAPAPAEVAVVRDEPLDLVLRQRAEVRPHLGGTLVVLRQLLERRVLDDQLRHRHAHHAPVEFEPLLPRDRVRPGPDVELDVAAEPQLQRGPQFRAAQRPGVTGDTRGGPADPPRAG